MPKVGGKHFKYTAAGEKKAREHAAKTGQNVESYKHGGNVMSNEGGHGAIDGLIAGSDSVSQTSAKGGEDYWNNQGFIEKTKIYGDGGKVKYEDESIEFTKKHSGVPEKPVPKNTDTSWKESRVKGETDKKLKYVKPGYRLQWFARKYPGGKNIPDSLKKEHQRLLDKRLKTLAKTKKSK